MKNFWWKETLENKMVIICDCCDDSRSCEQLKKHVTDKYFEKKLDFEYESPSVKGKICEKYMAYMFDRNSEGKNISD